MTLRRWLSSVDEIGEVYEVRPDVFKCTGQHEWCLTEIVIKDESGKSQVVEHSYDKITHYDASDISKIVGEITMTQQQYESEFDDALKAKSGVTCFQEAVEAVIWETYSLAVSFPSPV